MTYLQHVDPADENDTERDDLCPSCGEYLPLDPIWGRVRYVCGDCHGGTERDPSTHLNGVSASERNELAWREKVSLR